MKNINNFISLTELEKGQKAKIVKIENEGSGLRNRLFSMGMIPGNSIKLLQKFPRYIVQVGESKYAIGKGITNRIRVKINYN